MRETDTRRYCFSPCLGTQCECAGPITTEIVTVQSISQAIANTPAQCTLTIPTLDLVSIAPPFNMGAPPLAPFVASPMDIATCTANSNAPGGCATIWHYLNGTSVPSNLGVAPGPGWDPAQTLPNRPLVVVDVTTGLHQTTLLTPDNEVNNRVTGLLCVLHICHVHWTHSSRSKNIVQGKRE